MAGKQKAVVRDNWVVLEGISLGGEEPIQVGSTAWKEWLGGSDHPGFIYEGDIGHFSARREIRRGNLYWYAYRRLDGKLTKIYLGKSEDLTVDCLEEACHRLSGLVSINQIVNYDQAEDMISSEDSPGNQHFHSAGAVRGFSSVPLSKIKIPVLPQNLIARSRLTSKITMPVTVISAPAGFGKSTLLNEWRLSSGIGAAWMSLDDGDNYPLRFWTAVITALQTINASIGQTLLTKIRTSSETPLQEIIVELTNDIIRVSAEGENFSEIGLILDNFHRVDHPDIYSSLLSLIDNLPPNLKLVLAGRRKIDLKLGQLRAEGRLLVLTANDLRFTLEEGIDYIWQHTINRRLTYRDMEKLYKRSKGWITGLVLAVNVLSQGADPDHFVTSFTGAHPFLDEYFESNVLQTQSPEVQDFLIKSSVLRHLSGPLCNAVTGQAESDGILQRLFAEDLFLEKIDSEHFPDLDWYCLDEFFQEMLLAKLYQSNPDTVLTLNQKAANWYLSQNAPADAIYYLLASEQWSDAAAAIEKVILRELEHFGGGSRVFRWLQRLPEAIYINHGRLLGIYNRLTRLAMPARFADDVLIRAKLKIDSLDDKRITPAIQAALADIEIIQKTQRSNYDHVLEGEPADRYKSTYQILDGIQKFQKLLRVDIVEAERVAAEVYEIALAKQNLYGILIAGGACANLALSQSQLLRSEKIAHQVLEQSHQYLGYLPEAASDAITTLSRVYYERNQIRQAHQLLVQAVAVNTNPTRMEELVTIALLRAKIQSARGDFDAALMTVQAALDMLSHHPSNVWIEQDLISYQALFLLRQGNLSASERKIGLSGEINNNPFSVLTRAAILIEQERFVAAEEMISNLLKQYPAGYYWLPTIRARVMLASVLFKQHKVNQAREVMAETANLAGPEFFVRPFFVSGTEIVSLLSLVLHTENLAPGIKSFLKGTLTMLGHEEGVREILPRSEAESLVVAAAITPREQEVLHLLCANLSNKEIAEQCSISPSTVKTHLENIYRKMGVNSRSEATAHARMLNLV